MATTYDELKEEIERWLDNTNPTLVASIPDFIRDAENTLSRVLDCVEQGCHTSSLLTPPASACVLPAGEFEIPHNLEGFKSIYSDGERLWIYYTKPIPTLSNDTLIDPGRTDTNWLLQKHPDLYRYQALVSSEAFLKNDSRVPLWAEAAAGIIAQVQQQDDATRYGGSALRSRVPGQIPRWGSTSSLITYEHLPLWDFVALDADGVVCAPGEGFYTIGGDKLRIWPKPAEAE